MEPADEIATKYLKLSRKDLQLLATIIEIRSIPKGVLLLKEGEKARELVYVHSGMIRQFYYKKGKDITEHFTYEGRMAFCVKSLFKNEPAKLMMETLESSILYLIPYKKIKQLAMQSPKIAQLLLKIMEEGLLTAQMKADSNAFESAGERYEHFLENFPEVPKRVAVNYIASFLLMTPESLSRVRAGVL